MKCQYEQFVKIIGLWKVYWIYSIFFSWKISPWYANLTEDRTVAKHIRSQIFFQGSHTIGCESLVKYERLTVLSVGLAHTANWRRFSGNAGAAWMQLFAPPSPRPRRSVAEHWQSVSALFGVFCPVAVQWLKRVSRLLFVEVSDGTSSWSILEKNPRDCHSDHPTLYSNRPSVRAADDWNSLGKKMLEKLSLSRNVVNPHFSF